MSFLNNIFSNKAVQDMALGTLKKTMKENGFKYVVIELMDNGELDIQMHKQEDQPVIMSDKKLTQIQQIMQDQLNQINELTLSRDHWKNNATSPLIEQPHSNNTLKRDNDDNTNDQPTDERGNLAVG